MLTAFKPAYTRKRRKSRRLFCTCLFNSNLCIISSRLDELEHKLENESCSEERKNRQRNALGKKEAQFLRLRRTRLGLDDFVTLKVIGKGAFGEVCVHLVKRNLS